MADLTILSPYPDPLYPSLPRNPFKTFNPGASSSRFSLTPSTIDLTSPHFGSGRKEQTEGSDGGEYAASEDGIETASSSSSSSTNESQGPSITRETSLDSEECQSPDSYMEGPWSAGRVPEYQSRQNPLQLQPDLSPQSRGRPSNKGHRHTRSQSAPPFKTHFSQDSDGERTPRLESPSQTRSDHNQIYSRPRRNRTSTFGFNSGTVSELTSPSQIYLNPPWASGYGQTKGGELLRPPPPLHRPTTFWRRTPRSGVTSSNYSPSSHLIRRSTFIAAGLPFDRPVADMSALGVESRVRNTLSDDRGAKVHDVFWEVVVGR